MSFDTIDLLTGHVFQVTWDTGRRCNYDCSYCPVHRHDNFSPHATLDSLKDNVDFLYEYIDLHLQYRQSKIANIGFTGGEPTVNPNFIPFAQLNNFGCQAIDALSMCEKYCSDIVMLVQSLF